MPRHSRTRPGDTTAPNVTAPPTADFTDDAAKTPGTQTLTITLTGVNEAGTAYWVVVANNGPPLDTFAVVTTGTTEDLIFTGSNPARASGNQAISADVGTQTIAANIMITDNRAVAVYVSCRDGTNNRLLTRIDARTTDTTALTVATIEAGFTDDNPM